MGHQQARQRLIDMLYRVNIRARAAMQRVCGIARALSGILCVCLLGITIYFQYIKLVKLIEITCLIYYLEYIILTENFNQKRDTVSYVDAIRSIIYPQEVNKHEN